MTDLKDIPFSSRIQGSHSRIEKDFPSTARSGLVHLLYDLIEKGYISDWGVLARELQRIGRLDPEEYSTNSVPSMNQAKSDCVETIKALEWMKVFDFCERLHGHLARRISIYDPFLEDERVHVEKSDIQEYISTELQRLFLEERLGYEFTDGQVRRAGRKHTIDSTTKAQVVLGDPRLATARIHYQKALQFFRSPSHPDYANSVKESVCAVEAAGRELFPNSKAKTLGELAVWFQQTTEVSMPKSLAKIIGDVYGYRNGGNGVAHGGASGGQPTAEVAEFILSVCASQIIYLVDLANSSEEDLPF